MIVNMAVSAITASETPMMNTENLAELVVRVILGLIVGLIVAFIPWIAVAVAEECKMVLPVVFTTSPAEEFPFKMHVHTVLGQSSRNRNEI